MVKEDVVDASKWSVSEVGEWLTSVSPAMRSYVAPFAAASVDGPTLLTYQDADLEALGVSKNHRGRLLKALSKLRK